MRSPFNCGVYRWLNTTNGKSYIGSSAYINRRRNEHLRKLASSKHENPKFQNAWNKYGPAAFEFEMLAFCPEEDLLRQEQLAINSFAAVSDGYNISLIAGAPMRGRTVSKATREKISNAGKGRKKPEGFGLKISATHRGWIPSVRTRKLWSEQRQGKASEAQLKSLAKSRIMAASPECRKKIAESSKLTWQCSERRTKLNARTKASFEQALTEYLQSPNMCDVCGNVIMPLPHQKDKKLVTRLHGRKHCGRACANKVKDDATLLKKEKAAAAAA